MQIFAPAKSAFTPSWRSSCRQAHMNEFTAVLDRDTPHLNPVRMLKLGIAAQKGYELSSSS
ncbi:MAG: hypothetical protein CVV06_08735 [Gammaproteobacteria bacterium HGW-Gammaproteobacteria-10]|nr:MAG: hypothetical protein CVV06_08735 [Gammaproteobacteria bacterium HGW-Gammaproteobacteria-10]